MSLCVSRQANKSGWGRGLRGTLIHPVSRQQFFHCRACETPKEIPVDPSTQEGRVAGGRDMHHRGDECDWLRRKEGGKHKQ